MACTVHRARIIAMYTDIPEGDDRLLCYDRVLMCRLAAKLINSELLEHEAEYRRKHLSAWQLEEKEHRHDAVSEDLQYFYRMLEQEKIGNKNWKEADPTNCFLMQELMRRARGEGNYTANPDAATPSTRFRQPVFE